MNLAYPVLFRQRMVEVLLATGAISRTKLQLNHHHQQTDSQLFTGRMPFLSLAQPTVIQREWHIYIIFLLSSLFGVCFVPNY